MDSLETNINTNTDDAHTTYGQDIPNSSNINNIFKRFIRKIEAEIRL